jgi:hypothetical protein
LTLATNAAESGSPPTSLDVWQGRTGERCRPTTPLAIEARPGEESPHELLAVAPRGDWLAVIENHSAGVALVPLAEETSPIRRLPLAAQWLINVPRMNSFLVVVGEEFGLTHELLLVDWDTGQITRRFAIPNVLGMRVSPEGTLVAVGTRQSEVWLLDLANQTSEPVPLPHPNWAVPDAFTADGRLLATRGKDRFFRIWDLSTRSVLAPSAEFLQHAHCTFSANDRVLLSCNLRGKLELMSAWDGQPLAPALSLGQRPIMPEEGGFRFSAAAEGNLVVVGGAPSLTILDLDRFLESPPLTGSELIDWCALVNGPSSGNACGPDTPPRFAPASNRRKETPASPTPATSHDATRQDRPCHDPIGHDAICHDALCVAGGGLNQPGRGTPHRNRPVSPRGLLVTRRLVGDQTAGG